jgi:hypothetical protein
VPPVGTLGNTARYALGGVRMVTGTVGLLTPAVIVARFGDAVPGQNPAAIYALRMFGIRTVILGAHLILSRGRELDHALWVSPVIHASDLATVLGLRHSKQVSPEVARPLALISGLNTALAVTAVVAARRSRA